MALRTECTTGSRARECTGAVFKDTLPPPHNERWKVMHSLAPEVSLFVVACPETVGRGGGASHVEKEGGHLAHSWTQNLTPGLLTAPLVFHCLSHWVRSFCFIHVPTHLSTLQGAQKVFKRPYKNLSLPSSSASALTIPPLAQLF